MANIDAMFADVPTEAEHAAMLKADSLFGDIPDEVEEDKSVAFGSVFRGWNRLQQAGAVVGSELGLISPKTAAIAIAEDEADIADYPVSPTYKQGMEEIGKAAETGWGAMALAMLQNPSTILSVVGESAAPSAAALTTAAAGALVGTLAGPAGTTAGFVGGAGLGSFATEYSSSILDVLQEQKVDIKDAKAVEAALQNPELMSKARERAVKRGVPIAAFDALSFGLAGKLANVMGATVKGASKARKLAGGVVETAAQAGYGGGGELAGELVAGQEIDPRSIGLEAVAEIATGAPEVAIGTMRQDKGVAATPIPADEVIPGVTIVPADQAPPAPVLTPAPLMTINDPEMTMPDGTVSPADLWHGQTVTVEKAGENASIVRAKDGTRRSVGNNLLVPAPAEAAAEAEAAQAEAEAAAAPPAPPSPRLTEGDHASPIPDDIIDTGKATVEAATGRPSTVTTTEVVDGKRQVVETPVIGSSDLIAGNRAETQAVVSDIMQGVSTPEILAQTQPAAAPASAKAVPAAQGPVEAPAAVEPSMAETAPVEEPAAIPGTPMAKKGDTLADQIKKLKARGAALDAEVADLTSTGKSLRMVSNRDPTRKVIVGPDMSEPGMFRITYFDEQGPSGHTVHHSMEEAARSVANSYHPEGTIPRQVVKRDVAITPAGREVPVTYAVVEADDLITSQQDGGGANAAYPQELQPRDRSRGTSDVQINSIAQNLNPALLDNVASATDGAPIVSADGVVESGNGRVLGIRKAYNESLPGGQTYRQYLVDQGYIDSVAAKEMKNPVLVRIRQGQMEPGERTAFTREANERTTMTMSATEKAMADAAALSPDTVGLYRGGEVAEAGNRDFVRSFMQSVVSPNEQGAMVTPDGELSQEAIRRVQAALLAKAFGDPDLVGTLVESTDSNIKAIGGAMMDVAGQWSQMREEAKDGTISPDADVTPHLLEAIRLVQRARNEGKPLSALVSQTDIFSGTTIVPEAEMLLRLMFRNNVSWTQPAGREKLAEALRYYATEAQKTAPGIDLLGETAPPAHKILEQAKKRQYGTEETQEKLALGRGTAGKNDGAPAGGRAVEAKPRPKPEGGAAVSREAPAKPAETGTKVTLPGGQTAIVEHPDKETFRLTVDGKRVGEMNLTLKRSAPYATSVQVMGQRRLGVATALYDAAEKVLGRKLIPSPLGLSPEAIAFWKNRLGKLEPEEKQALLAESLKVGQEAGVSISARDRVDSLGYREPVLQTPKFNLGAPGPVATDEQIDSFKVPPPKTLDEVYEEAPGLQETLGELGKEIAADVEGVKFKNPGIKKRETAEEKFARKPNYKSAANMTDIVRAGFIVQNPSQANAIIKRLSEYFEVLDEGWFRTEEEYFDRKALIKFPSGQVGEIQFWEPNMFDAKMSNRFGAKGEEIYTEMRDLDPKSARALELKRQMFELYTKARGEMEPHWQNVGLLTKAKERFLKLSASPKPLPGKVQAYPTAKPDDWYSDLDYKARGGVMETMSPQEFLDRVRPLKIDEASRDNIDDLKRHIQSGRTLDPLKIYSDGTEDGRHRAVAAKELGIKEVPVIVFPQKERPKFKTGERPLSKVTETPQGPIHFAISPGFAAKADAVHADLRKKLDALGLTGVNLNVWQQIFADLEHGAFGPDGLYFKNMIEVSLMSQDPDMVLHHEAVHAMVHLGLFTPAELATLVRKSNKEWITDTIKEHYPKSQWVEEGIAFAYTDWLNGTRMDGMIARSFKKIKTFLKALYQTLTKHDIRTSDDIFRQMTAGEIGKRSAGKQTRTEPSFAITETVDMFEGKREQYVIPGAEKLTDAQMAQRKANEKLGTSKSQKSVESLPLFSDGKDQLALFSKPPTGPLDPRFSLAIPPNSVQAAQQVQQGFLNRGQPVDRAIRVPFALLGGLDAQGRWRPGKRLSDKLGPQRIQAGSLSGVLGGAIGAAIGGPIGGVVGFATAGTVGAYILGSPAAPTNGKFGWFHDLAENAKRGLIDGYGLDPEYRDLYRKSELGKISKLREGQELLKVLSNAGVGSREAAVLQAVLTEGDVADADMARLAVQVREAIDDMGAEAVSLGLISAESFERNRASYLHRVYKKNELDQGKGLASWVSRKMTSRRKKIIGDQLKGRGMFWEVDTATLMQDVESFKKGSRGGPQLGEKFRVLDEVTSTADMMGAEPKEKTLRRVYLPANEAVPAQYANWKDRGTWEVRQQGKQQTLWRDFTKEERTSMGELVDARYTIAKTFMLMANDLSTGRFFKEVSEKEEWTTSMQPPDGTWREGGEYGLKNGRFWEDPETLWVKVPDTNIADTGGKKKWGALAGKFVRAEIWRDLNEVQIANNPGTWRKLYAQWKKNKTARNPVVHMNNIVSNLLFMDLADVRTQDLVAGIKAFVTKDDPNYKEALDNGAFGGDMVSQEMRDEVLQPILDEIVKQSSTNPLMARAGSLGIVADKLWTWAKKIDNGMLKAYQMEDQIFRMAAYMRRRSQGESPKVAAANARDQFLDYDIRAPWVVAMRTTVLPFISYTYRAVPMLSEAIMHRPWKLAKYVAIAYALNALAYMGDDGDDGEERERAGLGDKEQGNTWLGVPGWIGVPRMVRMPWRDKHGLPVFLDIRRWIPAGDVFDTGQGSSALPIPAPLQFGGPLQLAYEFMLNKKSFDGEEITNTLTDTGTEKAYKVADFLWKGWAPNSFWVPNSWYWTKISNAMYGATDPKGRPYSVPQALLSSVGVKVKPLDVENGIMWHFYDFKKEQTDLRSQFGALTRQRQRGLISQSAFNSGAASIMEKAKGISERAKELKERSQKKPKP